MKSQQRPGVKVRQPAPANGKPAAATEPKVEEPPSPASSTSSSQFQKEVAEELGSPQVPKAAASPVAGLGNKKPPVTGLSTQKSSVASLSTQKSSVASLISQKSNPTPTSGTTKKPASAEAEPKQIEAASSSSPSANENENPPIKETIMEESIRVTRGRLRKTRSASTH